MFRRSACSRPRRPVPGRLRRGGPRCGCCSRRRGRGGVPVLEGVAGVAGAVLLGDGEFADGVLQRQHLRNRHPRAATVVAMAAGEGRASGVRARQNAAAPRSRLVITPVGIADPSSWPRRSWIAHRPRGALEFGGETLRLVVLGFTCEDETVRGCLSPAGLCQCQVWCVRPPDLARGKWPAAWGASEYVVGILSVSVKLVPRGLWVG